MLIPYLIAFSGLTLMPHAEQSVGKPAAASVCDDLSVGSRPEADRNRFTSREDRVRGASDHIQSDVLSLESKRDALMNDEKWNEALPLAQRIVEARRAKKQLSQDLGEALRVLGNVQTNLRQFKAATASLDESLKILSSGRSSQSLSVARTLYFQGNLASQEGEMDLAQKCWMKALEIQEKLAPGSLDVEATVYELGSTAYARGFLEQATTFFQRSLAIQKKVAPNSIGEADSSLALGAVAIGLGRLDDAEHFCERALALETKLAPGSLGMSNCLMDLGIIALNRGRVKDAQKYFERGLSNFERVSPGSLEVATALNDLGAVARALGEMDKARNYFEKSLAIQLKLAPDSIGTSQSLNNLGVEALGRGRLAEAQAYFERSLTIATKVAPDALDVARILNNLGAIYRERGLLKDALGYFERALAIQEKIAPDSKDTASMLSNLGIIALSSGRPEEAQKYLERSLALQMKENPNSVAIPTGYLNLGVAAIGRGRLGDAQSYLERALKLFQRIAPNSVEMATNLNNLANVALDRGKIDVAQAYLERSLAMQEKLAPGSLITSKIMLNLGAVEGERGRFEEMKGYLDRALPIMEKNAPGSLDVAACLVNLGMAARGLGRLDSAQGYLKRSLAIQTRISPSSLSVGASLNGLGDVALDLGDYKTADEYLTQALRIRKAWAPESIDVAATLRNLGTVALNSDRLGESESYFKRALALLEILAPDSLDVAISLNGLELVARKRGRQKEFVGLLQKRANLIRRLVARESGAGNDVPALDNQLSSILAQVTWLTNSSFVAPLYCTVAEIRGLILTLESRARLIERAAFSDAVLSSAIAERDSKVFLETKWIESRTAKISNSEFDKKLMALRTDSNEAQSKVSRLLKARDPRLEVPPEVPIAIIQRRLLPGQVLVEYVRGKGWNDETKKEGPDEYSAFLITKNHGPRFIHLGRAEPIDALVNELDGLISDRGAGGRLGNVSRALYNAIVKPLGDLGESVLIAPDGLLNNLPFSALVDPKGRYLLETKSISIVNGARDLIEVPTRTQALESTVIAGPQYDTSPVEQAKLVGELIAGSNQRDWPIRASHGGRFEPLPGALAEGKLVGKALGVSAITGARATEERLYLVKRPRVLHIATHGEFFPPVQDPNRTRSVLEFSDDIGSRLQVADNPMLRSVLAFAGANEADELRSRGLNDGWATALEISQMDLSGTELVVLSGCRTGLGDYRVGEGVFGLQRAFRFAGARTLIMSLFNVPDSSTQKLMGNFYKKWKPGMSIGSKLKAFREAQLLLLRNPKTRSPVNWAGFVLMGDR